MNAAEVKPSENDLAAALLAGADTPTTRAAVELLIAHRHWLRRTPLLRRIDWHPADEVYPPMALVQWDELVQVDDAELIDTASERGILHVAAALGGGWLGNAVSSCDRVNVRLIAQAVLHAGGQPW